VNEITDAVALADRRAAALASLAPEPEPEAEEPENAAERFEQVALARALGDAAQALTKASDRPVVINAHIENVLPEQKPRERELVRGENGRLLKVIDREA
jgi:hypothetical protein